jgi:hypothetical protein
MLNQSDLHKLKRDGWILKNLPNQSVEQLIYISQSLGNLEASRKNGNLIDELTPINNFEAYPKSLSARYGVQDFPFHTDTAYWKKPAKYIMLYAVEPGNGGRPSLLMDGYKLINTLLREDNIQNNLFKVINEKNSFLCNLLKKDENGRDIVRFDEGCMVPVTRRSNCIKDKLLNIINNEKPSIIVWKRGDLLILDNWRMLHARGKSLRNDIDRKLFRLTIT